MRPITEFANRIVTGDCIAVLKTMPEASVDLVLADPPYLVNYRDREGRNFYANDDNSVWVKPAFAELYRVLKPDRFCVCFYGWSKAERFLAGWKAAGFYPVGHLVWAKHYQSKAKFVGYRHECAYVLAKGDPPKPGLILPDVLEWQYSGDVLHPAQKPLLALVPLILAFSGLRDLVLDPFAGSGTTAVAAQLLGRQYIGIELDPGYAATAQERLRRVSA